MHGDTQDKDTYLKLTQVSAATKALEAVALGLLDEHLEHCIARAIADGGQIADQKIAEASAAVDRLIKCTDQAAELAHRQGEDVHHAAAQGLPEPARVLSLQRPRLEAVVSDQRTDTGADASDISYAAGAAMREAPTRRSRAMQNSA